MSKRDMRSYGLAGFIVAMGGLVSLIFIETPDKLPLWGVSLIAIGYGSGALGVALIEAIYARFSKRKEVNQND